MGFGEAVGEPEDLGQLVGLATHGRLGRLVLFPHGDDHEREQHGVDDADDRVDEPGHVVMLSATGRRHGALHRPQADDRDEHDREDRQKAVDSGGQHIPSPFCARSQFGPKIHGGRRAAK